MLYAGHNPAESSSTPSKDEFFLLMDGKAAEMKRGVHPGIFVNQITNGMPGGYSGFGPENGGLPEFNEDENKINPGGRDAVVRTYDDLGVNIRWAEFHFAQKSRDSKETYRLLVLYEGTLMRKSTGRFIQTETNLNGSPAREYAGQCVRLE